MLKYFSWITVLLISFGLLVVMQCSDTPSQSDLPEIMLAKGPPNPHEETLGNNLSFPVIWADGVTKVLRGDYGITEFMEADLWYVYATGTCDFAEGLCPDPLPADAVQVYQQQGPSTWQAESADLSAERVDVDWIDWGDNLESVDWYTRSKVRTEVVLFRDLTTPMLGYEMLHLQGLGIDELWGTTGTAYDSYQATIYSGCARLTIQKLIDNATNLTWDPIEGEWVGDVEGEAIFNGAVWQGGDGPGYYSAEINVKGKVIYGYTWDVRKTGEGAGTYRLTFSLDPNNNGSITLNTFFTDGVTQIIAPGEEEAATEEEPGGGGTGVIDFDNNLTYMDIQILERGGSGGGGGKGGGGGNEGGGHVGGGF